MNRALFNRHVRRLHLWFGLAIGAQVGLWLISGLFMTWFPIENVRGDHLKSELQIQTLDGLDGELTPADILSATNIEPNFMTLKTLNGDLVWVLETDDTTYLVNGETGEFLSPLSKSLAENIARVHYAGKGQIGSAVYYENAPREYGRKGPVWKVDFTKPQAASFYIDASTADVKAVRTGLWRTFDLMWGLHIMDWKQRDNFNSWWIKMTASLAVLFFISGLILVFLKTGLMFRRRQRSGPKAEQRAGIFNLDKAKK